MRNGRFNNFVFEFLFIHKMYSLHFIIIIEIIILHRGKGYSSPMYFRCQIYSFPLFPLVTSLLGAMVGPEHTPFILFWILFYSYRGRAWFNSAAASSVPPFRDDSLIISHFDTVLCVLGVVPCLSCVLVLLSLPDHLFRHPGYTLSLHSSYSQVLSKVLSDHITLRISLQFLNCHRVSCLDCSCSF